MNMYQSYENKLLLNLLAKSDEAAFTELYNRYWQKLFAIACNRLKDMAAAEDIVHDIFAMLWLKRECLPVKCIENYLAAATKYMVLNRIKKLEQQKKFSMNSPQSTAFELTAENTVHYKRILEIVKAEVEMLPEKCRLIFKYSRNEGMPVCQIASRLNLSPKTVENQLNKALRQLKLVAQPFFNCLVMLYCTGNI